MPDFTRLERAVMEALAWELRDVAPDLAGQFEDSLPGRRRNTGVGLDTEMIVNAARPASPGGATGAFGTVHALIDDLEDPVAFRVRLREGRLLALEGDAYGQDTRAVNFAAAPFEQIFTIDDQGRSIEFDPGKLMKPSPLLELQRHTDQLEPPAPPLVNVGALQRLQEDAVRPDDLMSVLFGARVTADRSALPPDAPVPDEQQKSLLVAIGVGLFALALLAMILFRAPLPFAVVVWIFAMRALSRPPVLRALGRIVGNLGRYSVRPGDPV